MSEKNSNQTNLKEALKLFHQDGFIDIIAGATLVNFGFDVLNSNETTSLFTWVPIILLSSMKNKTTIPRLGKERLGGDENRIKKWTFIPAAVMIILLVILGILTLGDPLGLKALQSRFLPGNLHAFVGCLVIALSCLVPAFWIPEKRFFIYSAVAFAAGIASYFFLPIHFSIFIIAAIMVALGLRCMVLFTRAYPLPELKEGDEN